MYSTILLIVAFVFMSLASVLIFMAGAVYTVSPDKGKDAFTALITGAISALIGIGFLVWHGSIYIDVHAINAKASENAQEHTLIVSEVNEIDASQGRSNRLYGVTVTSDAGEIFEFGHHHTHNLLALKTIAPGQQIRYSTYTGVKRPDSGDHLEAVDKYIILGVSNAEDN